MRPQTPAKDRAQTMRSAVPTAPALAVVVALLLFCSASWARAARRAVVMPFSGPRGAAAAAKVRGALRGVQIVPAGAFARAARAGGHVAAARRYGVSAVVKGSIARYRGRWMLRVSVVSGTGGVVGSGSFRLRGTRVDHRTARRIAASLSRWIRRGQAPGGGARRRPPRRRPPPPPPPQPAQPQPVPPAPVQPLPPAPAPAQPRQPTGFDDGSDIDGGGAGTAASDLPRRPVKKSARGGDDALGFEVSGRRARGSQDDDGGDDDDGGRSSDTPPRRSANDRPPWESIVEVNVGVSVVRRSFAFNDQLGDPKPPYTSNPVPAIYARGAVYPGAIFTRGVLADIGIVASFSRIIGLKSEVQTNVWADSFAQTFEIGLRHRWNVLRQLKSPIVRSTVQFGNQQFLILATNPPLPDISYNYLKLGAGVDWIYFVTGDWHFGASLDANFLYAFSAGPIQNADSTGYGPGFTGAFDGSGGVFVRFKGFSLHVEGFYRRFFYVFDMNCAATRCNLAGGALDIYGGATITAGYSF